MRKGSETLRLFDHAYAVGAECARAAWQVASREDRARAETWKMTSEDVHSLHRDLPESVVWWYRSEMDTAREHELTGCDEACEHPDPETATMRFKRSINLEREAERGYADELECIMSRASAESPAPCGGDCAGCG